MNALPLLETGLLLGIYVLLAGVWGLLYALDRAYGHLRMAAETVYGLHGIAAVAILLWAPLALGWKCLILAGTAAFRATPRVVWRLLEDSHRNGSSGHDRKHPQRSSRIVARL